MKGGALQLFCLEFRENLRSLVKVVEKEQKITEDLSQGGLIL